MFSHSLSFVDRFTNTFKTCTWTTKTKQKTKQCNDPIKLKHISDNKRKQRNPNKQTECCHHGGKLLQRKEICTVATRFC